MKNEDLELKNNPTLRDFQGYVAEMIKARGFDVEIIIVGL